MASNTKFGRSLKLYLANDSDALDLSEFQVQFETQQATSSNPNIANIRVFNLAEDTISRISKEFDLVDLHVGYDETHRLFFGQVAQFNAGAGTEPGTWLDIVAQDGGYAVPWTTVNHTLKKGWRYQDQIDLIGTALAGNKIAAGYTQVEDTHPKPRGKPMYGPVRRYMDQLPANRDVDMFVYNGTLYALPYAATLPGEAIVLHPDSGLIGVPERTVDGINITALIDPRFAVGATVQIDNSLIQDPQISPSKNPLKYLPSENKAGLYKIYSVNHKGDTRGNDWHSRLICVDASGRGQPATHTYTSAIPNRLSKQRPKHESSQ